jgi:hypothetical protein
LRLSKAFIAENEFAGPLPAAALDAPIICGIQGLEPTPLLVARYTAAPPFGLSVPLIRGVAGSAEAGRNVKR